jgi:nucleoside-diphosphate-sugar epimerase
MLTPGKVRELSHPDWVCDNTALSNAIGWAPRVLLPEGLRQTLGPVFTVKNQGGIE